MIGIVTVTSVESFVAPIARLMRVLLCTGWSLIVLRNDFFGMLRKCLLMYLWQMAGAETVGRSQGS